MKQGKYTLIRAPEDYPGKKYSPRYLYALEHRVVWWQNTGIVVPDDYDIHHKNHNGRDNRFENLEMISKSTHASMHNNKVREKIALICKHCKQPFQQFLAYYRKHSRAGRINFYCCRSHQVKEQHKNKRIGFYKNKDIIESIAH